MQTQAIYDTDVLARFLDAAKLDDTALLAGVIPLKSAEDGGLADRQRAGHSRAAGADR